MVDLIFLTGNEKRRQGIRADGSLCVNKQPVRDEVGTLSFIRTLVFFFFFLRVSTKLTGKKGGGAVGQRTTSSPVKKSCFCWYGQGNWAMAVEKSESVEEDENRAGSLSGTVKAKRFNRKRKRMREKRKEERGKFEGERGAGRSGKKRKEKKKK